MSKWPRRFVKERLAGLTDQGRSGKPPKCRQDYDKWATEGCTGSSYEDVLPVFKRLEANTGIHDA